MSSKRRRAASRANGKKSQGPVTPEGKARAAANATRHGLASVGRLAASVCLTIESREDFFKLHQTLIEIHAAVTPGELLIVEEMAVARWRLQRAWNMETSLFENQMDDMTDDLERDYENMNETSRLTLAFKKLADDSPSLPLLHRYETSLSRQIERCNKRLDALRAKSSVNPPVSPEKSPELSNAPNDPSPKSEHIADAAEHAGSAPPAEDSAPSSHVTGRRPALSPAGSAPEMDVFPRRAQRDHHEAVPEPTPGLPRAA